MTISFVLTAMMLGVIVAGLALRRRAPFIGTALCLAALVGLYFVWMPEQLSTVANALGVGRGADLVLYLWVSFTFLAVAGLVLELRSLQRQVTLLAREQALQRARRESPGGLQADPGIGDASPSQGVGNSPESVR